MSNEVSSYTPGEVATRHDDLFSDARVALIRNQIAKDAPEDVFRAMIDIAKRRNLDPLAKQISLIKFGGNYQMIVTIDGYRAIAEQTGAYAGMDAPVFTYDGEQKTTAGKRIPDTATVTVYKLISGQRYAFSAMVFWDEYTTGRNNWNSMPRTMLAKVAESHALRKAFPAVLSGTYTSEEMDQANAVETSARVVNQSTGEIHEQRQPPAQLHPQVSPEEDRRRARAAWHIAIKHAGVDDAGKAAWYANQHITSSNDVSVDVLDAWTRNVNGRPDAFCAYVDGLASQEAPAAPESNDAPDNEQSPENSSDGATQGGLAIDISPEEEAEYRRAANYTN